MGSKLKTETVLNDETSEIKRDLRAFGPIGKEECPRSVCKMTVPSVSMRAEDERKPSRVRAVQGVKRGTTRQKLKFILM